MGWKGRARRTTCGVWRTRPTPPGFNVVLLNQRNCGGTERLSAGLYHSGLTADADHVIREIAAEDDVQQVVVAGYSLGGNLALKLAGDYADAPPPQLRGVCAVSPVMELEACVRALERRQNFFYQWNFVRGLKGRMRRKAECFPGRFAVDRLDAISTVREFDEVYTAPHFGFKSASDYYHRASAMRVIDRVRVPARIITAEDDPFVPTAPFRDPSVTANPCLHVSITSARRPLRLRDRAGCAADGEATTATGPSTRSWRSRPRTPALEQRRQPLRKLRPQPLLFVLEVDVGALHLASAP